MDMDTTMDVESTGINEEVMIKTPIRPGYTEQVFNNQTYVMPNVLGQREGLSLAQVEKPDLREALKMTGGVRFLD